jgi:hypothetical protein
MRLASLFCLLVLLVGVTAAQDSNFPIGPQYLITGSPTFARPIATPTFSLDTPLPAIPDLPQIGPVIGNQPYIANPVVEQQPDLFPIYYGYSMPSVVEIVDTEPPRELPASIVDAGVAGIVNAQSLSELGYGLPLGDTASYWKSHRPRAPRVYTNADIARLPGM